METAGATNTNGIRWKLRYLDFSTLGMFHLNYLSRSLAHMEICDNDKRCVPIPMDKSNRKTFSRLPSPYLFPSIGSRSEEYRRLDYSWSSSLVFIEVMAIFIRDARFDVDNKGKKISGSIQSSVFVSKDSFLFFNLDEDSSISRILKVSTRTIRIKVERE